MSIPDDESRPQQPADGSVPPVPPSEPVGGDAAGDVPPVAPPPPAPPVGGPGAFPPAPPATDYGASGAYPTSPAAPVAAPTSRPNTVNIAFWLYIVSAVISIASGIVAVSTLGTGRQAALDAIQRQGGSVNGHNAQQVVDAFLAAAAVFSIVTLVFWVVVFVLFAFFMRRGANWARIVLTVLTALSLLNILAGYGLGALQVVVSIVAVVLMWLRPSSEYFNAVKAAKAPRA